ncbi:DUF3168 domain-containing protein [Sphingomonas sp.]|uniref:DUF3168 domain-containing protein n=1 Tax=Sphingomonas sp. TaxID=28214 RepID=UPI001B172396|nr:DUF3168 domain-containing protein [Sphingomonas sp.]MBO9712962.1 DUF3168 domain-containing protein [Sphingomonas sp.]
MSVQALLQGAVQGALAGHAPLAEALTGVFDAPPVRAARPYALVEEAVLVDWGTKDMAGREGRLAVSLFDGGERPERLRALAGAVEDALAAMPAELGEGWRVVTLGFVRSRIVRDREGWRGVSEFQVRMLKAG